MPHHPCTGARPAPYTALLLALSVVLTTLLPTGAAWATTTDGSTATPAATATAGPEPAATTAPPTTNEPASAAAPAPDSTDEPAAGDCPALPLAPFDDPGTAVGKASLGSDGTACFTVTAEKPGMHRVVHDDQHNNTFTQVFDGETQLDCHDDTWGAGWCDLPRAGAFTLKVFNTGYDPDEVTVAVVPLMAAAPCAEEAGTAWNAEPVSASSPTPLTFRCHPFTAEPGERITVDFRTVRYGGGERWITDETGAPICPARNEDGSKGCVLPGDGPYRVLTRVTEEEGGFPAAYTLGIRRLSDPAGCATVPVNAFNSAPTAADASTGCRTFTAPAAGRYDVYEVQPSGTRAKLTVYDTAGKTVCETYDACALPAAGTYTALTPYATLILDRASTKGCEPAALGTHQGAFTEPGEIDCLELPLPEGARMAALAPLGGAAPHPDITVVDADGVPRCHPDPLSAGTCALTGKAPFRAFVSSDDYDTPTGAYRIALHRTDVVGDCRIVPAGDFTATSASARFRTGDGVFSHCLTIPAGDHRAVEVLQLQAVSAATPARFSVLNAEGHQICGTYPAATSWTSCGLAPGLAHTVLVTGYDHAVEYTLTRRDVTATAKGCTANPATPAGGPSTSGTPGAPGTLQCRQVTTADARDTLHLNVRDALGTTNTVAFGADGTASCSHHNKACAVTGSTSYQVLVYVPAHLKAADSYRFDALRIGTAAGPAPECVKVPSIAYGYGPITGTLDEQHTAVCAALPTAYSDRFDVRISDTAGATETAVPSLHNSKLADNCVRYAGSGWQCSVGLNYSREVAPTTLVLSLPEKASRTAYSAELVCQTGFCGIDRPRATGVTPTTGESGTEVTVTVTGTALHQDDKVVIKLGDRKVESTTVSVSADRTALTATLDLTGTPAGNWNTSVYTRNGWEFPLGTFTITPAPLRNTAAPSITGTARVGTAVTATKGTWSPTPSSYAYQWRADGQPISGATAATYTPTSSLLNKKLSVSVTARATGSPDATATSAAVTVATGLAPKATTAPTVSGTVRVGTTVTAVRGAWSPTPTSYAYQWRADGQPISGATAATYTPTSSLLNKKLSVTVVARRTGHANGSATTAGVTVALGLAPRATTLPAITGTAKVGRTLTASRGAWTPPPTSYAYQWYANGTPITGATASTFVLKSAQAGKRISVKVIARRTGHTNGSALSKVTAAVAR
ncbi:IPT/TIG domain-containing protein [Streptomyces sp. NPDC006368]|uniref:IPT/TIG domain-containing protein n=1 Tax=Streptomyces sp. NPDC006368 TaxID=3156760 RepID=UPI0033A04BB2